MNGRNRKPRESRENACATRANSTIVYTVESQGVPGKLEGRARRASASIAMAAAILPYGNKAGSTARRVSAKQIACWYARTSTARTEQAETADTSLHGMTPLGMQSSMRVAQDSTPLCECEARPLTIAQKFDPL